MSIQYTNIRLIADKILRHPLMQDLNFESIVDYTIDFMRIVGCPNMFEEKVLMLEVKDYRAKLPDDFYRMLQVRTKCNKTFRYADNTFHLSDNKKCTEGSLTYKIQGGVIFTSIKDAMIEISYEAILTDEDGYPLLPDNSDFTRALQLYIKKEWFTILYDMGKINGNVLQQTLQDYAWAVGDCHSEFNRLTLDKAESFYNTWRKFATRPQEHHKTYRTMGA